MKISIRESIETAHEKISLGLGPVLGKPVDGVEPRVCVWHSAPFFSVSEIKPNHKAGEKVYKEQR